MTWELHSVIFVLPLFFSSVDLIKKKHTQKYILLHEGFSLITILNLNVRMNMLLAGFKIV